MPDWSFTLKFKVGEDEFTATRKTEEQDIIIFNNTPINYKTFKSEMLRIVFGEDIRSPNTFRPLITRFIRNRKASYNLAEAPVLKEQAYYQCANNSLLLGLDVNLVREKHRIKKEKDKVLNLKRNIEKDEVLNSFFTGNKDVEIELEHQLSQINELESNLENFAVAEDYHNIQKEADEIAAKISNIENKRSLIEISIENIKNSLKIRPDVNKNKITAIYEEAKFKLNDAVKKELDSVVNFHESLVEKRKIRLGNELNDLRSKYKDNEKERSTLGKKLDKSLYFLNEHKALDEFLSLSNKLSDLKSKAQKLEDYKKLIHEYDIQNTALRAELSQSHVETQTYLDANEATIQISKKTFTNMAHEFYENKPCGITLSNNDGDNQTRFNIKPKIQSDSGDGVNEVKIFCYDLMLLQTQMNHNVKFVFHDSRIFSDMDPNQRETAFRVAHHATSKKSVQYIATVNEDQLLSFKEQMDAKDYKEIIDNNVQLELTDKDSASKLLGIEVDLEYDD